MKHKDPNSLVNDYQDESQSILLEKIDELDAQRSFTRRVMDSSNSVISYFIPIVNDEDHIVDFKIEYVNQHFTQVVGEAPINVIGKKMSTYYPENFQNGVFEELIICQKTAEPREFKKRYVFGKEEFWFASRVVKLDEGVVVFSKDISKEKEFELELNVKNNLLSKAEHVANIGSYKLNLSENFLYYSDNAFRIFGFEPGDFTPNLEVFYKFIHPDDLSEVKAYHNEIFAKKTKLESTYRIITKDKKIKTVNSVGEFYKRDGHWFLVGVLTDLTKQMNEEQRLRYKNMELKRTNDHLESFNRIASHDLQEPLRKIQMFISRITEQEGDVFSKDGFEALSKVNTSAKRMRDLISNLLTYSKIEKIENKPSKVDLNVVLENVKEDLAERISENEVQIISNDLSFVSGIQFQLEQVFSNLIENSIKYRKPNVSPIITIECQVLSHTDIDSSLNPDYSKYLEITFEDNGIGFDSKYEDKIFEIFKRLHTRSDYPGSGLGLSICQKIVTSHHGRINGKGVLGEGAIFTIYLPYSE